MGIRLVVFGFSLATWILLHWSLKPYYIVTGLLLGGFITFMTADMFARKPSALKNLGRYIWFLYYIPLFLFECLKANIDGMYRVIHPAVPMHPGIVKVKTTLRSDTGLTLLTNTITLQPGTMTIDVDKENGYLYVHWVDVKSQDVDKATEHIVAKFEKVLKRMFE